MGQTIICEYLAEWAESNRQPDPRDHGFDGIYSMLEECQNVMFALGESANEKSALAARVDALCVERGKRIVELQAQLAAALATIESAAWCHHCGMPAEHCRENHAEGKDYAEGCKP